MKNTIDIYMHWRCIYIYRWAEHIKLHIIMERLYGGTNLICMIVEPFIHDSEECYIYVGDIYICGIDCM